MGSGRGMEMGWNLESRNLGHPLIGTLFLYSTFTFLPVSATLFVCRPTHAPLREPGSREGLCAPLFAYLALSTEPRARKGLRTALFTFIHKSGNAQSPLIST